MFIALREFIFKGNFVLFGFLDREILMLDRELAINQSKNKELQNKLEQKGTCVMWNNTVKQSVPILILTNCMLFLGIECQILSEELLETKTNYQKLVDESRTDSNENNSKQLSEPKDQVLKLKEEGKFIFFWVYCKFFT